MRCGAERGHARVAAHEPDHHALDRGIEAEAAGEDLVKTGRSEAGAAGDDQVSDSFHRLELSDCAQR